MAQRNPMNQRYQGDGPGGQTRKSAARAKPATQAASSVHVRKKPQTDAEKRAARKAAEKEAQRKAEERAQRQAEREKAEREKAELAKADNGDNNGPQGQTKDSPKGLLGKLFAPSPNAPSGEEYRKWRKRYWILLVIGIIGIAIALMVQMYLPERITISMIALGVAYVPIISAFIIDRRKVQPIVKEHQRLTSGNKSPKQLKHEQEAKERAAVAEAARKAAREAKKTQKRRKSSDTIVPGEEQE
ncbi:MAG: hypothetical protein LBH56_01780 [Coriobacteriales bacterium]|jgi:membrane protein involved in colicin uptake|nr:hypothetical protein [Coriobacteriales bacterium]